MQCTIDRDGTSPFTGVKGCMQTNCTLPCGLPLPDQDAGPGGP